MEPFINQIIHADCMDILRQLPDKSIDLVLTDFPYNEVNRPSNGLRNLDMGCADELAIDLPVLLVQIIRVCKGSFYAFCGTEQVSQTRKALVDAGFSSRLMIWEKTNPSPMNGQHIWLSGIECCVYGKAKNGVFHENCKNTVLRYPLCNDPWRFHTTQKPLALFEYLVQVSSNPGDLVLDPFSGSGTTAVACHNLKRRFICIEKNENYFLKSRARLDACARQLQLF